MSKATLENTSKPVVRLHQDDENRLSPLGEKIFLDRYALKDGTKESLGLGILLVP